jgi:hypothetical protein
MEDEFSTMGDIKEWSQLCAELYKRWQVCRRKIDVSPDRDYAEEDAVDRLEKKAQSLLISAGISPYGMG